MYLRSCKTLFVLTGLAALCLGDVVSAQQLIPVANAGFENPIVADGTGTDGSSLPGWTLFNAIAHVNGVGVFNPGPSSYAGGLAPEGQNVAFVNGSSGGNGMFQVLTGQTLQADTPYTLTIAVGYRLDSPRVPDYGIELLAGGSVLTSFSENISNIPKGTFVDRQLLFTAAGNDSRLGQTLEIRLSADEEQVNFDNVRLSIPVASTPEPGNVALLLGVTVPGGLLWHRQRKRG